MMIAWSYIALAVLLQAFCSEAFLPNHLSLSPATANDYTHSDITETAILRMVARLLEDNPLTGATIVPGSLTGISPLTAQALFDGYYGGGVSATKLQAAIDQIVKANNDVDIQFPGLAAYQFNGEKIVEGNTILQNLRISLYSLLASSTPDLDATREAIGHYMHTMQMFYSNTNYLELKGNVVYSTLGFPGAPMMPVPPPSMDTCTSCSVGSSTAPCTSNLISIGQVLTSGYRAAQDIAKPNATAANQGKCSHGGTWDNSAASVPIGGINKETSDPKLSPHYHLHEDAGQLAIMASEALLDGVGGGLREEFGDDIMKQLFNIGTGVSMVLVIDITGSMGNDIIAVQTKAAEIVKLTQGTVNAPYNYVLSTFGDPASMGSVRTTKNANVFLSWVNGLTVSGGGDCPELSMLGIERGLQAAMPGSDIYVFTDASAKDPERFPTIASLVATKKCKLQFLLTGQCSSRSAGQQTQSFRSNTRAIDPLYALLANASGGGIITTDKDNIGSAASVITEHVVGSPVTLYKMTVSTSRHIVELRFDETITEASIQIIGESGKIMADLYQGGIYANRVIFGTGGTKLDINIDKLMVMKIKPIIAGAYSLQFNDSQTYTVEITGNSPFNFKYQFVKVFPSGLTYPISGNPIAGEQATIIIETIGQDRIKSVDTLFLTDMQGNALSNVALEAGTGKASNMHKGVFTLPTQDFRLMLVGKDNASNDVIRTLAQPVTPDNVMLTLLKADTDNLVAGSTQTVPFHIKNYGADGDFDVNISNQNNFVQTVTRVSFSLKKGQEGSGQVTFSVGQATQPGTTSMATFTVTSKSGATFNYVTKNLVVAAPPHLADLTPPYCTLLAVKGGCTTYTHCKSTRWSGSFAVQDDESGIQLVRIQHAGKDSSISVSPFILGTKTRVVTNYSSTCCDASVIIAAADISGNEVLCKAIFDIPTKDFKPTKPYDASGSNDFLATWEFILIGVGAAFLVIVAITAIAVTIINKNRLPVQNGGVFSVTMAGRTTSKTNLVA
ncbi:von Willebrand factor A domain-containing protein 7-like isoform X2 [Lineus longissimus]|uniref:von Willebrand factor A domain-containing protein 7-like isoform X2 n=1 Tax=Lineus longissimus TaxID=88925 RepID=UPI00315CEE56